MEALKPSEVLSRAADLVEPVGAWCQGAMRRGDARCIVSALVRAMPRDLHWDSVHRPLSAAIRTDWFTNWNDAPGRTQAEVVAALRKAADLARESGQ